MSDLERKSIHELRSIAQGMGLTYTFGDAAPQLISKIRSYQTTELAPPPVMPDIRPRYDAGMMERPPSRMSSAQEMIELLEPYRARGLVIEFPAPEEWHMRCAGREDSGNMRMPLMAVLRAAERLVS